MFVNLENIPLSDIRKKYFSNRRDILLQALMEGKLVASIIDFPSYNERIIKIPTDVWKKINKKDLKKSKKKKTAINTIEIDFVEDEEEERLRAILEVIVKHGKGLEDIKDLKPIFDKIPDGNEKADFWLEKFEETEEYIEELDDALGERHKVYIQKDDWYTFQNEYMITEDIKKEKTGTRKRYGARIRIWEKASQMLWNGEKPKSINDFAKILSQHSIDTQTNEDPGLGKDAVYELIKEKLKK